MILAKGVNFFLCAGLVTCMSPSYKRKIDELFSDDFEDALQPQNDEQSLLDWYRKEPPPSVQLYTADPPPSVQIPTEDPPPSRQIGTHNPAESEHAKDIIFVKYMGSDHEAKPKSQLRQQVVNYFRAHVMRCSVQGAKKIIFGKGFKHLDSSEEIDWVHAYVFEKNGKYIVRVKDATSHNALKIIRLLSPLKQVFERFYTQMDAQLMERCFSDEDRISIFNAAANWLLKILTTHDESLPVIGMVKPGTDPKDYKFGKHQLSLIEVICHAHRGNEVDMVAQELVEDYLENHPVPDMEASIGIGGTLLMDTQPPVSKRWSPNNEIEDVDLKGTGHGTNSPRAFSPDNRFVFEFH